MFLGSCWVHIAWSYCGGETMVGNRGFDVFLLGGAWCRSKFQYILGVLAHLLRVGLLFCFGDWTHPKDYLRIWRLDASNVFFFETAAAAKRMPVGVERKRRKSWTNRWFGDGGVWSIPKSIKSGFVLSCFVILGRFLPLCSLTTTKN